MEWNTPIGEARSCGGDSLMRREALNAVGGFDGSLIAGEEPELCFRLRQNGWRIWRLDRNMTIHDAAMTRFGQWWRRMVRSGWAYAEGYDRHGATPEQYRRRNVRTILLWGGVMPIAISLSAILAVAGAKAFGFVTALILTGYAVMVARAAIYRHRQFNDSVPNALRYGLFAMLGRTAEMAGLLRYHRRGQIPPTIIEYKDVPVSNR
jgi:hypothetical protein